MLFIQEYPTFHNVVHSEIHFKADVPEGQVLSSHV